jgi:hypothetical protein
MKDSSMAKAIFIALSLLICGWFITLAVDYIGDTEDTIITVKQTIEDY